MKLLQGKVADLDKKIWLGGIVLAGLGVWWWQSNKKKEAQPSGGNADVGTGGSPSGTFPIPISTGPVPGNVIASAPTATTGSHPAVRAAATRSAPTVWTTSLAPVSAASPGYLGPA